MKLIKRKKSIEKKNSNVIKKIVLSFILGAIIFGTIGVGATTLLYSKDVTYDNTSSGMSATTVQTALDELYEQAKSAGGCPEGYKCVPVISTTDLTKNVVTSGSGLYADSTESGRYVYKGANPNNYIIFSGSTWRILAVESDRTLKTIKQDSVGNMKYDDDLYRSWSSTTLNTYLNGTYYNSLNTTGKSYIQKHSFNVGNVSSSSSLTTTINEEKSKTWTGNIALANVSDYIKSNTNTSSCGNMSSINSNASTCKTSSFIGKTMWFLSLYADISAYGWYLNTNGSFQYAQVKANSNDIYPVLYLSSSITLSGSGTQSDPYTIN